MNESASTRTTFERRECVDCSELFEISQGERDFLVMRGLSLPKRCRECRRQRKLDRHEGVR